jgi:predicted RND superfamily exporter protein
MINVRSTRGEVDALIVEDLMEKWPATEEDFAALRARVFSNPIYLNTLISTDATFTTILMKAQPYVPLEYADIMASFDEESGFSSSEKKGDRQYLSNEQNTEIIDAVTAILDKYRSPEFPLHLAGSPVVVDAVYRGINKTWETLTPISILLTFTFLFIMFRRISGVLYPVLIVCLSLLATLGVMAWMGIPVTHVTMILPSFLIVVGVGDSVHILAVFYLKYKQTLDKEESIIYALGHSALAVLMTSLTTAMGLLSFAPADVAPISDLGIIAPIGVMLALLYTVVLLPALIALFPIAKIDRKKARKAAFMDRMLNQIGLIACGHPLKIILISVVLVVFSIVGITKIRFSHNAIKWLPKDLQVRRATKLIDENLKGTVTLEVVVDTGEPGGLYEPEILNRLEKSITFAEKLQEGDAYVGKAWTVTTILKEINRALNENRPEFYSIPQDRNLVAQEFLLFENSGSDDLEDIVDMGYQKVRFTIKSPFRDSSKYIKLMNSIGDHFGEHYPNMAINITGHIALFIAMIHNTITTMTKSYIIAFSVITILMIVLIGRVRIGMLSMVPNLAPIIMILGIMGLNDIPMDFSNILVGSVAIGLVVDDTIHFMHNFRRYLEQSGNVQEAVQLTLQTTGRAILITSIVLSGGFFICMLAEMKNTYYYGLLTGSAVVLALVADFFLTPALMMIVHRKDKSRAKILV